MGSFKAVGDFLEANGWRLIQYIDLGMTARVFVVEREDERQVLKTRRGGPTVACTLRVEHEILRYLNETDMARYVPAVGEWIREVDGFLMEYLRYPTAAEWERYDLVRAAAVALRTLHGVALPPVEGVEDDRPFIHTAIKCRLEDSFRLVTKGDDSWAGLPAEDKPRLEYVCVRYETYVNMLPALEAALADAQGVLAHGDLSGDNLMVRQDGSFALADWGEVRITSNLTDVAYLLIHVQWDGNEVERFLHTYFDADSEALEVALPAIETLSRLYRYNSCVRSLLWLNNLGADGLDAIGRAFLEKQLNAL